MKPNSIITVWGWDPIQLLQYGDETKFKFNYYSIGMRPNSMIILWGWDPIQSSHHGDTTRFIYYSMGIRPNSIITSWGHNPIHLLQYGNQTQFNCYIMQNIVYWNHKERNYVKVHQYNILTQKEILVLMVIWQLAPVFLPPLLEDKEEINHVHKIVDLDKWRDNNEWIENIQIDI